MGTIVCKECDSIISHFEDEKATVLYGTSQKCNCCQTSKKVENE